MVGNLDLGAHFDNLGEYSVVGIGRARRRERILGVGGVDGEEQVLGVGHGRWLRWVPFTRVFDFEQSC